MASYRSKHLTTNSSAEQIALHLTVGNDVRSWSRRVTPLLFSFGHITACW